MDISTKDDLIKVLKDLQAENSLLSEKLDSITQAPKEEDKTEGPEETSEEEKSEEELDEISKLLLE